MQVNVSCSCLSYMHSCPVLTLCMAVATSDAKWLLGQGAHTKEEAV